MKRSQVSLGVLVAGAVLLTGAWWASPRSQAQPTVARAAASRPATTTSAPASGPATTSAPSVRAVHAFVTGKVQGVGFRNFVVTAAKALKVTGWVKNLPDGRVEAVIEGPSDKVDSLLAKMKVGPRAAKVEDLKVTEEKPTGEFKDFTQR